MPSPDGEKRQTDSSGQEEMDMNLPRNGYETQEVPFNFFTVRVIESFFTVRVIESIYGQKESQRVVESPSLETVKLSWTWPEEPALPDLALSRRVGLNHLQRSFQPQLLVPFSLSQFQFCGFCEPPKIGVPKILLALACSLCFWSYTNTLLDPACLGCSWVWCVQKVLPVTDLFMVSVCGSSDKVSWINVVFSFADGLHKPGWFCLRWVRNYLCPGFHGCWGQ